MSNYVPTDAVVITSLPFNGTQGEASIEAAPTGTGYAASCISTQYHAVWYVYTTGPLERFIAVNADVNAVSPNYRPYVSIWTGTPPTLTQYTIITAGNTQRFCGVTDGGLWFNVPVSANTTYYFQIEDGNNTSPVGTDLLFNVLPAPNLAVAAGSLLISDDADGYPATALSAVDGQFLQYIPDYPAGEVGDSVVSGVYCVQDGEADTGVAILNQALQRIASVDFSPATVVGVKSDRVAFFYVCTTTGTVITVHKVSVAGVASTSWTLPANSQNARIFAVNRTGTKFYYAISQASEPIHMYNMQTSSAGTDLHAGIGTEFPFGFGDGYVDMAGNILIAYASAGTGANGKIRRFNAAGTILDTYTVGGNIVYLNHFVFGDDSPGSFWLWGLGPTLAVNPATFQRIALTGGTTMTEITDVPVISTSGGPLPTDIEFAISNSCPLLTLTAPLVSSPTPGSLGPITERPIRRVRETPILWDGSDHHRMKYNLFELLGEVGGPRDDISLPLQFALQISRDGGNTWGPLRWQDAGMIGQYTFRMLWWRNGLARDCVIRIIDSNAARVILNDLLLDAEQGTS